jgi:hypothetical protein
MCMHIHQPVPCDSSAASEKNQRGLPEMSVALGCARRSLGLHCPAPPSRLRFSELPKSPVSDARVRCVWLFQRTVCFVDERNHDTPVCLKNHFSCHTRVAASCGCGSAACLRG